MMKRSGRVFADRFHSRVLRTPTEVRNALHYLRHNHRHHVGERDGLTPSFVDPYTSEGDLVDVLPEPTVWLLRTGWRRASAKASSE